MRSTTYSWAIGLSALAAFVGGVMATDRLLAPARLDFTENRLFTLAKGTQTAIADLSEPVELTLYYSAARAADFPAIRAYGARVRELLAAIAAKGGAKVRLAEIDPAPFSEQEDQAIAEGLQPIPTDDGGDPIYFGLVGRNALDETTAIAQLDPAREPYLEYEITRMLGVLEDPAAPRIGVLTSLPLDSGPGGFARDPERPGYAIWRALDEAFDVTRIEPDFAQLPADLDALLIAHPGELTVAQSFAIEQFLFSTGRALILLDPASYMAFTPGPSGLPSGEARGSSALGALTSAWGVSVGDGVLLDRTRALPVQATSPTGRVEVIPHPGFILTPPAQLSRADLTVAALARGLHFAAPGFVDYAADELPNGLKVERLVAASDDTMIIPSAEALGPTDPRTLLRNFTADGETRALAVRLTGKLPSAFAAGPPPGVDLQGATLGAAQNEADVILVADSDLLDDSLYFNAQAGAAFVDNAAFIVNALDVLAGGEALVGLRSRAPSLRPMELLDRMRESARARLFQTQAALEGQLAEAEAGIAAIEAQGRGSGFFAGDLSAKLTEEEEAEIERFRERVIALRGELRGIEREFRKDVARVEGWIAAINIWLAPIGLAIAGLVVFQFRRQHRRSVG